MKISFELTKREFLKKSLRLAGSMIMLPYLRVWTGVKKAWGQSGERVKVVIVKNGDCFQNISQMFTMLGGITRFVDPDDCVVIKTNGQWPRQGYTHTGCVKAVIDEILAIPGFSGEIFICDNIQRPDTRDRSDAWLGSSYGFNASSSNRTRNWPDHNWLSLAQVYQDEGKPVAVKSWESAERDPLTITGPAEVLSMPDQIGWVRDFFQFHGRNTCLSYPVFESPLTPGRVIDMKNGVWENGQYTGRKVKAIFMPTLNNHGSGSEDYAGITSAIKCFFGATEIQFRNPGGGSVRSINGHSTIHSASYSLGRADYAGELAARFITEYYAPILYITAAVWTGWHSRTGQAAETNTVVACENPATLDYVAVKDVVWPCRPDYTFFNTDDPSTNTRKQIDGCLGGGVGTIDPDQYEVITYDFNNPSPLKPKGLRCVQS